MGQNKNKKQLCTQNVTELVKFVYVIRLDHRGATGAARGPKPGKAPIMAARHRCRLLFFKIEVRPRPCRPYRVRRCCKMLGRKFQFLTQKWSLICWISKLEPENSHFRFTLTGHILTTATTSTYY